MHPSCVLGPPLHFHHSTLFHLFTPVHPSHPCHSFRTSHPSNPFHNFQPLLPPSTPSTPFHLCPPPSIPPPAQPSPAHPQTPAQPSPAQPMKLVEVREVTLARHPYFQAFFFSCAPFLLHTFGFGPLGILFILTPHLSLVHPHSCIHFLKGQNSPGFFTHPPDQFLLNVLVWVLTSAPPSPSPFFTQVQAAEAASQHLVKKGDGEGGTQPCCLHRTMY